MFTCNICSKKFSRRDNMRRHTKMMHDNSSETSEGIDSDEEPFIKRAKLEESGSEYDDEEEEEEEEEGKEDDEDPWDTLIDLTFQRLQPLYEQNVHTAMETDRGLTEEEAKARVFHDMKDKYRKSLATCFGNMMVWINQLKRDRVYKTIKSIASDLELMKDYESEEAWLYAIKKRKFLFEKLIRRYEPPEIQKSITTDQTEGKAGLTPVQVVEKWSEHEIERIKNAPPISIIGRKY